MKALTLWRPWAWAIIHAGKDIENRTWAPPRSVVGERIAIHAGRTLDEDAFWQIEDALERDLTEAEKNAARAVGIIGTVRIGGFCSRSASPWFGGPCGWVLDSPIAFAEPIACRGAQGLWDVPAEIARLCAPTIQPPITQP